MKLEAIQQLERFDEWFSFVNFRFYGRTCEMIRIAQKMDPRVIDELAILLDFEDLKQARKIIGEFWVNGKEMPHPIVLETIQQWIQKEYLTLEEEKIDEPVANVA